MIWTQIKDLIMIRFMNYKIALPSSHFLFAIVENFKLLLSDTESVLVKHMFSLCRRSLTVCCLENLKPSLTIYQNYNQVKSNQIIFV